MLFSKEKITSFKLITLTLKGMRCIDEYELVCDGEDTEVAYYTKFYTRDGRELNRSAVEPTENIIKLLNDCKMLSWNGFHGANPRGVRDGWMFELEAELNDGVIIRAEGSNNYPRHYREVMDVVNYILNKN